VQMTRTTHQSFCRVCHNACAIVVEVEDGRAVSVTGDRTGPVHHGYTCVKGRAMPALENSPSRLLHSLKRNGEGSFSSIAPSSAVDEIAERVKTILETHGPRSIALYNGTKVMASPAAMPLAQAFMAAIGSPMQFTPNTIDQPGKSIAKGFHGSWMAPAHRPEEVDVALYVGCNPLVSYSSSSTPIGDPGEHLKRLRARGGKIIALDPRRSPLAARADIHLQVQPGEDLAVLAGMLHVILKEGLYDAAFVAENVDGLDRLRAAVEPFDPQTAAARAGVDANELIEAARMFAGASRGIAGAGTGPSMGSAYSTLVEYLVLALDTVCGHWARAGELVRNPGTLIPLYPRKAQAQPPTPAVGFGESMRVRGLTQSLAGLPSAALAEEILLPGDGQIRALFVLSGNPVVAFPDQLLTIEAMKALDLLVVVDVAMSETAKLADYVIAPTMSLEVPGFTLPQEFLPSYSRGGGFSEAAAQYTPAVTTRPEGSDLVEEWELFYDLAARLGLQLEMPPFHGTPSEPVLLDMQRKPTTDELFELMARDARVPLAEVKKRPSVALYPSPEVVVGEKENGWEGRLDVGSADMMRDLAEYRSTKDVAGVTDGFKFRLLCRRLQHVLNSSYNVPATNRGRSHNLAYLHPEDLTELGLQEYDLATITSAHGSIPAIVAADKGLLRGMVSMAHGFGGDPTDDSHIVDTGSSVNRLIPVNVVYERYSGQPLMSNVPVNIERAPAPS
jgi:anaerobic selenocysteine-containing dehydrogenase